MDILTTITAVTQKVTVHYMTRRAEFSEATQAHLDRAQGYPSPVERCGFYAEALYAARADMADEDRTLTGQIAHFMGLQGWALYGFGDGPEGRGGRMFQAMRRDLDEPGASQAPADDPEPREDLVPPAPEEPAPEDED